MKAIYYWYSIVIETDMNFFYYCFNLLEINFNFTKIIVGHHIVFTTYLI